MYSKLYICNRCDKEHQSKCDGTVKYIFPVGVYKNKLSVFEELEEMGVRVRESVKHEKWLPCFDFQTYQRDFGEKVSDAEENSLEVEEGTSWNKGHVPVLFSVRWTGWRHVMCRIRILESWCLSLLLFC